MADINPQASREEKILRFWRDNKIFEKSLELRNKAKRFVFFEGPPTANGRPGIHHFIGRSFKDLFCRYKTMRGFFVLRKAGWDTHGLPVELEVEKELGFKNKKDIENYGIEKFNKKAKESVWKYKAEWEDMTRKMGFWLDMSDPYITYETNYIESLWSIIKKIWDKKLLYLAHRVVPFCTRCGTPLSSHEVAQGYKKVTERSVYIKFKLISQPDTYILAWTTTPWTLPGNVALAVGAGIKYQAVSIKGKDEKYILAEDLVSKVLNTEYIIHNTLLGSELIGLEYEPLFDIEKLKSDKSYRVYDADFVSTGDGTGIVHTAVMYGEDDYNLGTKIGLPKFHTVDEAGKFIHVSDELNGRYVKSKETEDLIVGLLEKNGNILKTEDYEHDYPFCWRCGTALLYYAKNSWFIRMSEVNKQLLKNNQKINWVPEHIKEGRFGQWLKEGKDWAFSRERYWGTPLPIWKCNQCDNFEVVGSLEDLDKKSVGSGNTYFVMRHGHSTRNEDHEFIINSSRLESDKYNLTEQGQKEVEASAMRLAKTTQIDEVYASPFRRTKETAQIASKIFHHNIKEEPRISEFLHSLACEGKKHTTCPMDSPDRKFDQKDNEGESWNDVRTRMTEFMSEMERKHKDKKILIVSHGDPLWLLNLIAGGVTAKEAEDSPDDKYWYPKIAEIKELDWKNFSRNELGELDLHRPFIDSVVLRCKECGSEMKKIPDLIDVWFDSGAMPYAQWHWPFENKKMFSEQFPADFIVEGIDQTRGWFYTLLAISTLLDEGAPFKTGMSLGHILDEKGQKMSKSKGNVVSPFEVMEKVGADTARWYFYTLNSPGESKLFSMKDVESKLKGFMSTLENCVRFYELYAVQKADWTHATKPKELLDGWILSKLHGLVAEVTKSLDNYDPTTAARAIEKFVGEDFSNWWLRRSRKRKEALDLLRFILLHLAKIVAPFIPFTAEDIKTRMHKMQKAGHESVHLNDWPKVDKKLINKDLETKMKQVQEIVAMGLAQRKDKQMKVRQPLRSVSLGLSNDLAGDLEALVKEELNIKNIIYDKSQKDLVMLDFELDQELIGEGYARELVRQIQDMRKEAKYKMDDLVSVRWHSDDGEVSAAINKWSEMIAKDALLKDFINGPHDDKAYDIEKEFELVPGRKIWIGVKK